MFNFMYTGGSSANLINIDSTSGNIFLRTNVVSYENLKRGELIQQSNLLVPNFCLFA